MVEVFQTLLLPNVAVILYYSLYLFPFFDEKTEKAIVRYEELKKWKGEEGVVNQSDRITEAEEANQTLISTHQSLRTPAIWLFRLLALAPIPIVLAWISLNRPIAIGEGPWLRIWAVLLGISFLGTLLVVSWSVRKRPAAKYFKARVERFENNRLGNARIENNGEERTESLSENSENSAEDDFTFESIKTIREIGTSLLSAASLVLTINFGLVTSAATGEMGSVRWQITLSSISLVISIIAGVFGPLAEVIEMQRDRRFNDGIAIEYLPAVQAYAFAAGLVLLGWAVLVRVGVI